MGCRGLGHRIRDAAHPQERRGLDLGWAGTRVKSEGLAQRGGKGGGAPADRGAG